MGSDTLVSVSKTLPLWMCILLLICKMAFSLSRVPPTFRLGLQWQELSELGVKLSCLWGEERAKNRVFHHCYVRCATTGCNERFSEWLKTQKPPRPRELLGPGASQAHPQEALLCSGCLLLACGGLWESQQPLLSLLVVLFMVSISLLGHRF